MYVTEHTVYLGNKKPTKILVGLGSSMKEALIFSKELQSVRRQAITS